MIRRTHAVAVMGVVLGLFLLAAPAAAQQQISLNIGYFAARGAEGRVAGDTIVENLFADYPFALGYQVSDFDNVTFGGEWLFPLGKFLEGGVGVNYYQKTVPSFYLDLVDDATGNDITQDLRLRTVPITATIRFLPLGRRAPVQPYIGAGVGIIPWNYSENGDFADPSFQTFTWEYKDSGTAVGPVIFGGVRVPVSRAFSLGGEIRYQQADSELDPSVGFQGTRIDLGGITYQANFIVRF
jgi:opacity protein-like surface antigen